MHAVGDGEKGGAASGGAGVSDVALVHDWLNGMRGGERCLELIAEEVPAADIYTLLYVPDAVSEKIRRHRIHASALRFLPFFREKYRYFLPLFPWAVERFRVGEGVKLVVSTSHCVAKGVRVPAGARHLCYCFTPMRYAWALQDEYFGSRRSLRRRLVDPALRRLRAWDVAASERVDRFVAISRFVQGRIREFYGRESAVVYPPVDADFFTPARDGGEGDEWPDGVPEAMRREGYDLVVSALVPYKRVDLAVAAARRTGRSLVVAGAGSEEKSLREGAPANVAFVGRPSDQGIRTLYRHCRALVFPGVEDFGIVPLEVQACGRPVVAFGQGGALETVVDGKTGLFFGAQDADALAEVLGRVDGVAWDGAAIRAHAETFGQDRFLAGIRREAAATRRGERL